MNNSDTLPKTPPSGSLHLEWKRCGRRNCRCNHGLLHGPYAYHHRRDRGLQKKTYVSMASLLKAFEDIERQKAQSPINADILRLLKEPNY